MVRKELANNSLHNDGFKQACWRRVEELLGNERVRRGQSVAVSVVFKIFRKSVIWATEKVVGCKICVRGKKRSAWWRDDIKEAVREK